MAKTAQRTMASLGMCVLLATGCAGPAKLATVEPFGSESAYLSNITQLTYQSMGFINAGEAYFSPDAERIIFQATPKGKEAYQIYTMDLKKLKPKLVSSGHGACTCAFFHPRKDKIIFASSHLDPNADKPRPKDEDD